MRVRLPVPGLRLRRQNIAPHTLINNKTAFAVLTDRLDPLLRITVLHHGKGSSRFPNTQHGDKGARVARKFDHDKIFRADAVSQKPCVDAGGQLVHLLPRERYLRGLLRTNYPRGLLRKRYPRGRLRRGLLRTNYPRGLLLNKRYLRGLHLDKRCRGIFRHHLRPAVTDIRNDIQKPHFHNWGPLGKILNILNTDTSRVPCLPTPLRYLYLACRHL